MKITIEKATLRSVPLLSVLGGVTFYEAYYEQDAPDDIADYITEVFSPGAVVTEMSDPNSEFYIGYADRKAVGFIKLIQGTAAEGIDPEVSIELKRIYTVERVWGTGVGSALLNFSIERSRRLNRSFIWLGVWEQNVRAQKFYAKFGFEQVGTISFPYGDSIGINRVLRLGI